MPVESKPARRFSLSWQDVSAYTIILVGALLQALAMRLFLVPAELASGGISGLAQLIHYYTGLPIGVMTLVGNIPLFVIGWRYLGGQRFALRTATAVLSFSLFVDILPPFLPENGLTSDLVLNALYGGVVSGIGFGLVYRGRGTSGGSDILARVLSHWRGITISTSYLVTDAVVILLAGLTLSWEKALYALVSLYVSGISAEATAEGSNVVRTALIVTEKPDEVTHLILHQLERGVTRMDGRGGFTGMVRPVLYSVVSRSEVGLLKTLVCEVDPKAFIVIGHASEALGEGFRPLEGG